MLLHYCREYWDGKGQSISPLTPADREEVLSIYDRWQLEHFHVVAFAYTPIPLDLQDSVEKAFRDSEEAFAHEEEARKRRNASAATAQAGETKSDERRAKKPQQTNCVFIVDPYTGFACV